MLNILPYLITNTMPIEVFITIIFLPVVLIVIGFVRTPRIPALIVVGGMIFFLTAVITSQIQMGNLVANSTLTGATTTYKYNPDLFQFTNVTEMLFALIGAVFIMFGGMITYSEDRSF